MKKFSAVLAALLCAAMLAGCAGTPVVYYTDCTCPVNTEAPAPVETTPAPAETAPAAEGAVKTGLALFTSIGDSASAQEDQNGEAKYEVTMVAVLVDDNGVIQDCIIDGITTSVKFDTTGTVAEGQASQVSTKNELGENYGMVAYGGAVAEWDAQAAALADFAVGKTVAQLKDGSVIENGRAKEGTDLATMATIYLGGYVDTIEMAVNNAVHLGAMAGDELKLASLNEIATVNATAEESGNAQLDSTVTAMTMKDGVITSCTIDAVQAKVGFDNQGVATIANSEVATKNQLGEAYGMVAWGGAIAEWDQQAASFASYIAGKTVEEVKGIAVNEKTAPAEADLATSVTIAIGGFQALIEKAAQ